MAIVWQCFAVFFNVGFDAGQVLNRVFGVVKVLREAGLTLDVPKAAIYVWAKLPLGVADSRAFCSKLLDDTGVSTTPGSIYGKFGEGYLRISVGLATHRLQEGMQRFTEWMRNNQK
ncbi:MAG: aminotransferase class I/II-fold pyridoxal phosphate-dependent enzyme [Desulfobulbaceae bacterium]|nr:aminotransferase class I/II-fold pyridoxal phosphate-dependent enzyme [Desulfobulbaceae bacterium]